MTCIRVFPSTRSSKTVSASFLLPKPPARVFKIHPSVPCPSNPPHTQMGFNLKPADSWPRSCSRLNRSVHPCLHLAHPSIPLIVWVSWSLQASAQTPRSLLIQLTEEESG